LDQRVVGLLAMKPNDSVLDQIFVTPTEQRKGIGGVLVNVAKQAMPNGFTLRMDASNEKARRFYEKHGLRLLREGIHPRTGIPVHFFGWKVR
jgi:GNAT superfamily N-acetyltransferase